MYLMNISLHLIIVKKLHLINNELIYFDIKHFLMQLQIQLGTDLLWAHFSISSVSSQILSIENIQIQSSSTFTLVNSNAKPSRPFENIEGPTYSGFKIYFVGFFPLTVTKHYKLLAEQAIKTRFPMLPKATKNPISSSSFKLKYNHHSSDVTEFLLKCTKSSWQHMNNTQP